jgi:hypothetical protein
LQLQEFLMHNNADASAEEQDVVGTLGNCASRRHSWLEGVWVQEGVAGIDIYPSTAHSLNPARSDWCVEMSYQQDSPLSIAASITGILTFVAAVVASFYARALSLKSAIDTQAEVSLALEKIDFLETETDMLNNAFLASQIRHPDRKYGNGDFKYFQGLYANSLHRMRVMDNDMRNTATLVTGENQYETLSRVKMAANWMASRDRLHKQIEERKAESTRIFQIQLAMLSA